MDFEIAHDFDAPAPEVAEALLSLEFQESLSDLPVLKTREVLDQEEHDNGTVVRRVRCVLDVRLNDLARRFLGDGDPAWVEEAVWHPAAMRWDWTIHPEVAKDMLDAKGHIHLEGNGEGSTRSVAGVVKVRGVPLYGGRVESWIVDGIKSAYDEEADRLAAWLAG